MVFFTHSLNAWKTYLPTAPIGIVLIFELQNLKKSRHSGFRRVGVGGGGAFSLGNKVGIFDSLLSQL